MPFAADPAAVMSMTGTSFSALVLDVRPPVPLAMRLETSSATLLTICSTRSGGIAGRVTLAVEGVATSSLETVADDFLPLFCFLVAGGLEAEAESRAERFGGIPAKKHR